MNYRELLERDNNMGHVDKGEIEIVLDKESWKTVSDKYFNGDESLLGIVAKDPYTMLVRDVVKFPKGDVGIYTRLVNGAVEVDGYMGAASLPFTKEGKIMMRPIYRHSIRDWSLEIARGCVDESDKNILETGKREAEEELGYEVDSVEYIGEIYPDTGILTGLVGLVKVVLGNKSTLNREDVAETFGEHVELTVEELERLILEGKIKDSFTVSAYFMAKAKGMF